ncbi:CASP-like protein 4D1 [Pistacia vera]|uniref:CASP-like protein 4D1 n=1 Tax=Pistacia vera TaxID=55513 RepID=UPI001263AEA5|nr:CASP-like protein 4D1 [Pistacia vera]
MASKSKSVLISVVVLRLLTLGLLAASIVLLYLDKFTLSGGTKISFKDVIAYRYVIATGIIGFLYSLCQIPFALYHASKGKRLIRNRCLLEFDFFGDKIIAFLLATGVGAGFAVTFELKKLLKDFIKSVEAMFGVGGLDETDLKTDKFL